MSRAVERANVPGGVGARRGGVLTLPSKHELAKAGLNAAAVKDVEQVSHRASSESNVF